MRLLPSLALFLVFGCGQLDNSEIRVILGAQDTAPSATCQTENPLSPGNHVLAKATVNEYWVGWLHTEESGVEWSVDSLPEGIHLLNPSTGLLVGRPTTAGLTPIRARANRLDCPESEITVNTTLQVQEPCTSDCGTVPPCGSAAPSGLQAYVHSRPGETPGAPKGVEAGESYAIDQVSVLSANELRPAGSDTTHRMRLSAMGSKDPIIIHYSLPGGVYLPIEGDVVDLRYIRGHYDDHYLFLTLGSLQRFVAYSGFLSRDELATRCPENPLGDRCRIPGFDRISLPCGGDAQCGEERPIALDVLTDSLDPANPAKEVRRLQAGAVARRSDQLLRIVDAWERSPTPDCPTDTLLTPPFYVAFYQIPLAACSVTEAKVLLSDPEEFAPAFSILDARILFPFSPVQSVCTWTLDGPDPAAVIPKGSSTETDLWLHMPLAGTYQVRVTCTAVADGKLYRSCLDRPAVITLRADPVDTYRVELIWSGREGSMPELTIGPWSGKDQSPSTAALDLSAPPAEDPTIRVHYAPTSPGNTATVRIWHDGQLIGREEKLLEGIGTWEVGILEQNGYVSRSHVPASRRANGAASHGQD